MKQYPRNASYIQRRGNVSKLKVIPECQANRIGYKDFQILTSTHPPPPQPSVLRVRVSCLLRRCQYS